MEKEQVVVDWVLVPMGLILMLVYHLWLLYQIVKQPTKTFIGINAINRRFWVCAMMEDVSKNGVLAVQTLRNNIMASTVLASMAITLCSVVAILMESAGGSRSTGLIDAARSTEFGFSIKLFSILVCFLLAFFMNVQSIRYFSHSSILINVPYKKILSNCNHHHHNYCISAEYVGNIVNRGSYFWSLGLRAFYFSFPLFFWIFGPVPMFLCCIVMVFMFFFLDVTIDFGRVAAVSDHEVKDHHHNDRGFGE